MNSKKKRIIRKRIISIVIIWELIWVGFFNLMIFDNPLKQDTVTAKTIIVDDRWDPWWPPDYMSLGEAVRNANASDIIRVHDGYYKENKPIVIDKSLYIYGLGSLNTFIECSETGGIVITADNVTLKKLTIRNATKSCGIKLKGTSTNKVTNCSISNIECYNNGYGISIEHADNNRITNTKVTSNHYDGIQLKSSSNNIIKNSVIKSNKGDGFIVKDSTKNNISTNSISDNLFGVNISSSLNNEIYDNTFTNDGLILHGDNISHFNTHYIPKNNLINNKPLHYHKDKNGINHDNISIGELILVNCSNIKAKNLEINNTDVGIEAAYCSNSFFLNNNISSNSYGNYIVFSSNSSVSNNYLWNNSFANYLESSSNISISNNYVWNNSIGNYLKTTNNTKIYNNTVTSNVRKGFLIEDSSKNNIINNAIQQNGNDGLNIISSPNNNISCNYFSNNSFGVKITSSSDIGMQNNIFLNEGIFLQGDQISHFNTHTIQKNNLVNKKPIYYHKNKTGINIDNISLGQLILANCSNVEVKNLTINDTDVGIETAFCTKINFINNNLKQNYYGLCLSFSTFNNIINNGIFENHHGIYLINSNKNLIRNSNISFNNENGIYVDKLIALISNKNVILNCSISNNSNIGIDLSSSSDWNILNSTIKGNSGHGIYFGEYSSNNSINNSKIIENTKHGIMIFNGSYHKIINSTISNNVINGIQCYNWKSENREIGSNHNLILNNSIYSNNHGIYFFVKGFHHNYGPFGYLRKNSIIKNNIFNNRKNGIQFYLKERSSLDSNLIIRNTIHNNSQNGIFFQTNDASWSSMKFNKIHNNVIIENKEHGIYFHTCLWIHDNEIFNNTIRRNQKNGIYFYSQSKSYNNYFYSNIIQKNYHGFVFRIHSFSGQLSSSNDNIYLNKIEDNPKSGIYYYQSVNTGPGVPCYTTTNNKIFSNLIINNVENGIFIRSNSANHNTFENKIYNNYFNNSNNYKIQSSKGNIWNIQKTGGKNIIGGPYLGGNYWSDYLGIDTDGDGIGNSPYVIGSDKDLLPLVVPKIKLYETYSNSTNISVSLSIQRATLNASIKGDLNGTINFTDLELVKINSSYFTGTGFFKANWTGEIEGFQYNGTWQGMMFNKSNENKIFLNGTVFGGLQGLTEGYLAESITGSGVYDLYNSNWTLNYIGLDLVFAKFLLNGTVNYQSSKNDTSEIKILQSSFKGNASEYYNTSLDIILTQVMLINKSKQYYGQGFSIITYNSKFGSGSGWTYDKILLQEKILLTGFFTKPLWGLISGILNESEPNRTLSLTIMRIDLGLPPGSILNVKLWGFGRASPGQNVNYFLKYSNTGLKTEFNTEIIMYLPRNTTYISNTGSGIYNSTMHQVIWRQNISAKSTNLLSVKCKVKWGLPWGTKLICTGYIRDYLTNSTLVLDSYSTLIITARDPNMKYGPEGYVNTGQQLNYTIEFENEGMGIAYGVYFTDILSENLNDSTLIIGPVLSSINKSVIAPPGIYNSDTRSITWFVGEVDPGESGFANISIKVRDDVLPYTEILNYAIVYFPSVPEITRTNGIVSIVKNKKPIAKAGENLIVNTLQKIVFNGSSSIDPDGVIINYTWNFGDGKIGYGQVTSHNYLDDGNYTVNLTVMDNWGIVDSHEVYITVLNRAPEAYLQVDSQNVKTMQKVTFNASKSSDLDGTVSEYYYDFGDGTNSDWVRTEEVTHEYLDGTNVYTAKLTVKDDDGEVSTNIEEVQISITNREPIAELSVDLNEAYTYENILFSAKLSVDIDGQISSYFFDFGDGTNSGWITTKSISHQYTDGTLEYTISLKVKDDDGIISSNISTSEVLIKNRAPKAVAGSDQTVDTNQLVQFSGESSSDKDGRIKSLAWDFGDGSYGKGKNPTHIYKDNGHYSVTLTVKDDDGSTDNDKCIIIVNNVKPIADFKVQPESGDVTTVFEFMSKSVDTDGTISKYFWEFGDGTISEQINPTHQFKNSGEYVVSLVVQDDDELKSDMYKQTIIISNLPPIVIGKVSTTSAKTEEIITFDASDSYDIDSEVLTFSWQFGDGGSAKGKEVQYSYQEKGTYTVTLTIHDDSNNIASTSLKIEVYDLLPDFDGDNIPDDVDTDDDNDGLPDTWEKMHGLNNTDPKDANIDSDDDLLTNHDEYLNNTNPNNPDTDFDTFSDKSEIDNKTNPLDKDDYPKVQKQKSKKDNNFQIENYIMFFITGIIIIISIIFISYIYYKRKKI